MDGEKDTELHGVDWIRLQGKRRVTYMPQVMHLPLQPFAATILQGQHELTDRHAEEQKLDSSSSSDSAEGCDSCEKQSANEAFGCSTAACARHIHIIHIRNLLLPSNIPYVTPLPSPFAQAGLILGQLPRDIKHIAVHADVRGSHLHNRRGTLLLIVDSTS